MPERHSDEVRRVPVSITTTPFDAATYIDDDATRAELLDAALATGDHAAVIHALATIARVGGGR